MLERPPAILLLAGLVVLLVGIALGLTPQPVSLVEAILHAKEYAEAGLYPQAMAHYQTAQSWQPYRNDVREQVAILADLSDQDEVALKELSALADANSLSLDGWQVYGDMLFERNRLQDALSAYKHIPLNGDQNSQSTNKILAIFVEQRDWQAALEYLDRVAIEDRDDPEFARRQIGFRLILDPSGAVGNLSSLSSTDRAQISPILDELLSNGSDPQIAGQAYITLGRFYESVQDTLLARACHFHAWEVAPDSPAALANLARFGALMGDSNAAYLEQALVKAPADFLVNQLAGEYWLIQKKPDIALGYLHKAVKLNPSADFARLLLGNAQNQLGDYSNGLRSWQAAAEVSAEPVNIWRQIARFCVENQIQVRETGLPAVQKLLLLEPEAPENLDLAGQTYLALADALTGERYLRRAVEVYPDYYPAQLHLGMWYLHQNRLEEGTRLISVVAKQNIDPTSRDQAIHLLRGE
jgi:tetratricopeptide (TPR) repeat protein